MTAPWTALLRLARREVGRHPGRALLVVLLIALPVAGVVAATTWYFTVRSTPAEQAAKALGEADLAVYPTDPSAEKPPADLPEEARVSSIWRGELQLDVSGPGLPPGTWTPGLCGQG